MNTEDLYLSTNSQVKPKSIYILFRRDKWMTDQWFDNPVVACFDFDKITQEQATYRANSDKSETYYYIQSVEYKE